MMNEGNRDKEDASGDAVVNGIESKSRLKRLRHQSGKKSQCSTCGATDPNDVPTCSNGFHASRPFLAGTNVHQVNSSPRDSDRAIALLREARRVILGPLDRDVVTQIDTFLAGDYPGEVASDGKMHLDWCLALNGKPCNCCHVAGKKS